MGNNISLAELAASHPFWTRVREVESGCWEWQGSYNGTKPVYAPHRGESWHAKRWVLDNHGGGHPKHKRFISSCRNHKCVRPDHLLPATPANQFWQHVNVRGSDDCWEWLESTNGGGYGTCRVDGVKDNAHRHAYRIGNGPIPDGMLVCHKCDNRICCNPAHLFLGTYQDNVDDMWAKGRGLIGEAHQNSKLTEDAVASIRKMYADGMSDAAIAKQFWVSESCIYTVTRRRVWQHVA